MANDLRNEFSIKGSRSKKDKLTAAIKQLSDVLSRMSVEDALWAKGEIIGSGDDKKTFLTDRYGTNFTFRSAWGPCDSVQDQICWILQKIDTKVVIENRYSEEFHQVVGSRVVTIENGQLISYRKDYDPSDKVSEIQDSVNEDSDDYEEQLEASENKIDDLIEAKMNAASKRNFELLIKRLPKRRSLVWI